MNLVQIELDDDARSAVIAHADSVCLPRRPKCGECPLVSFCKTGMRTIAKQNAKKIVVLDLFAGAGGMGYGFQMAGYKIGLAVELDRNAAQSYRFNNPGVIVMEADVAQMSKKSVIDAIGKVPEVIVAGPPCQSFSLAGNRADDDPRHHLFQHIISLAEDLKPLALVIENVAGIARQIQDTSYKEIVLEAMSKQFNAEALLLDAIDFGVPQTRRRYFFIGLPKDAEGVGHASPTHSRHGVGRLPKTSTVIEALAKVPRRLAGSNNDYHVLADGTRIPNLSTMAHSPAVIAKIKAIESGGPLSYRRLRTTYATTIVAGHRALPVHPSLHRTISVREAAQIQGFEIWYNFLGKRANQPLQVANAVPPPLASAIARKIKPAVVRAMRGSSKANVR